MEYYRIEITDDLNIVGHYPQAKYEEGYNPKQNGVFCVDQNRFPDFVPRVELRLHQKSIPTDYLGSSLVPFGLIISEKMKDILKKSRLPKHRFYPITVYQERQSLTYYWFHFIIDDFWTFIDKNQSYGEVLNIDKAFSLKRTIPAISMEENKREILSREANTIKKIGKIVMKNRFPKYDFYKTAFIEHRAIISGSLKKVLEEQRITGMEIKPFEGFVVEN